jgi:hypothetical protein
MGRPRKEQIVDKDKKIVSDKQHIKMLQDELVKKSQEIVNCKNIIADTQTAYSELLDIIGSRNQSEDFWIDKFDKLSKEHDDVFKFLYETVQGMKDAFRRGIELTGDLTMEDFTYHMNLLLRMIEYKFLQEEKEN